MRISSWTSGQSDGWLEVKVQGERWRVRVKRIMLRVSVGAHEDLTLTYKELGLGPIERGASGCLFVVV